MARILILYASVDGQTQRIASRIGAVLERAGHRVLLMDEHQPGLPRALEEADAVIVGAGIRFGRHSKRLTQLARQYRGSLAAMPSAFFSVSLSAGGPGAKPKNVAGYIDDFIRASGWQPRTVATFGGALRYSRYNPFMRLMMKLISGAAGGETDTSSDYEYTDWAAVERFAASFAQRVSLPAAA
jgi:menaquinone-dependent protoporphyrinogen oxidase